MDDCSVFVLVCMLCILLCFCFYLSLRVERKYVDHIFLACLLIGWFVWWMDGRSNLSLSCLTPTTSWYWSSQNELHLQTDIWVYVHAGTNTVLICRHFVNTQRTNSRAVWDSPWPCVWNNTPAHVVDMCVIRENKREDWLLHSIC